MTRPGRPWAEASHVSTRLLVHAMVREDATVDTGDLYAVANCLGMTDQQVRLCIKRLVAEGRFTHQGRGRKALLWATPEAIDDAARDLGYVWYAYEQDQGRAPWDGRWQLIAFAVPEAARDARDALREEIVRLGGAAVQNGLYVAANPIAAPVEQQARRLGVLACVTFLTSTDLSVGGRAEPADLAAALWPVPQIAARYTRLADLAERHLIRLDQNGRLDATDRAAMAIQLAAAFTDAMDPDPLLPPELLPRPWDGARARALFARCWIRLQDAGQDGTPPPRLFRRYSEILRESATSSAPPARPPAPSEPR
ncbi:PaaX family transcriptional regulator C-terminal domain-containing protein [Micromonospora sp. WMMA1363]|uniref:PaaX family transcriptional regulator C-terminal domain-containing protein n=1 Tax=Micromonospora sp. WMMA1363 TaxID=3053985 RepID=UPI00259CB898|nr:PaaX family transcriptional regulator C-terminal domain-containing protein [Micromonospora sp. WMMA1363]MDM4720375.1 PaaX family transcriptional regulator C-terminal domain-containing protein [Micromonospora sp. WMMA1363]